MNRAILVAGLIIVASAAQAQQADDPRVDCETAKAEDMPCSKNDWLWSDWPSPESNEQAPHRKDDLADQLGIDDIGKPAPSAER